jgi:LysR family glycine cleavage system transcriptional activator
MKPRRLPSLTALRAFEATARHASAKRAAEELHVTPTAISHQLRRLEEELGVQLFIRRPRRLALTSQGRELLAAVQEAFDSIADAVARLDIRPARSTITLSTTPAIAARWLLPWVCILRDINPQLDLRIHTSHELVALDGVSADVAIRYGRGGWPGLVAEKLFDNVFVPVCRPDLGIRDRSDLPQHTLIHFDPPGALSPPVDWSTWQRRARVPGLDATAGPVFSDETHAIAAVLDGQGIALMSRALIEDELRAGRLVQPFGPELRGEAFHFVYPESRRDDADIKATRDWVLGLRGSVGSR